MLAHSSPTLIAACHVLHRLYVPRHPRIALTSRLRVHTTNDITGCPCGSPTRQSSARWPLSGADDYNLSQIIYMMMSIFGPANRSFRPRHAEALSELPKQSSMSKIKHLTASILRTHSQCQIRVVSTQSPCSRTANRFSSSSGYVVSVPCPRARQSQRSCALWARFSALAVLVEVRGSFRCLVSSSAHWWSLSGSNR
jgi:hypothetical protein